MSAVAGARILALRTVHDGWTRFLVARVALPDGTEVAREIEDHGAAVAILPYDAERRVSLLVRQMRTPALHAAGVPSVLEVPAGVIEDDEEPAACARRELFEEVGLQLETLEPVGSVWALPGISTERMHLFLAPYVSRQRTGTGDGLSDEAEHIVVEEIPLADLAAAADAGRLDDMKTLALVQTLRIRQPALFT